MAKIWYFAPGSSTLREQRPLPWCVDKLWISPRDFRSPDPPHDLKAESVWVEVSAGEAQEAPGYKPGFYSCFLAAGELEECLRKL